MRKKTGLTGPERGRGLGHRAWARSAAIRLMENPSARNNLRKSPGLKKIMAGRKGFEKPRAMNVLPRLAVDRFYMRKALAEAGIAGKKGEVPVGAILLYKGRVLSAHNLVEQKANGMAHAEMILLEKAAHVYGRRLTEATMYVSLEPCAMCVGAMIHMRLGRLVFAARDPERGAVISKFRLFDDPANYHKPLVSHGIYEKEAGEMLREFFRKRRMETKACRKLTDID